MAFRCDIPATSTVQLDDAFARITRWDFAPGAITGWHEHGLPYFVTMLVAGTLAIDDGAAVTEVTLDAGQSYRRSAGIRHDVKNASPHPIAFVEIEVKQVDEREPAR